MLSAQELQEIRAELAQYEVPQAATVEALTVVQRHRGWVSDECLADIAALLGLSPAELDGVATFYNLMFRRPVGRHVILVCDSVSCWITGYERLGERISRYLGIGWGETSADGRFTLLPSVCLGTCEHAPAMMIGEDLHQDLDPDSDAIERILDRYA